ncbi:hypothetical protein B0H16DRAFT_1467243 [Mycena metata]|uniref:Uncharacterized protein n=1 Tax=Mycena metata TaxID=1033252 RepID=A0AAD7MVS5_9AGAR|nr:hypothetical protein B0H16DRAFT_1467243 [Mycena metata]
MPPPVPRLSFACFRSLWYLAAHEGRTNTKSDWTKNADDASSKSGGTSPSPSRPATSSPFPSTRRALCLLLIILPPGQGKGQGRKGARAGRKGDHAMTTFPHAQPATPHPIWPNSCLKLATLQGRYSAYTPLETLSLFRHLALNIVVSSSYGFQLDAIRKWALEDEEGLTISKARYFDLSRRSPTLDSDKIMAEVVSTSCVYEMPAKAPLPPSPRRPSWHPPHRTSSRPSRASLISRASSSAPSCFSAFPKTPKSCTCCHLQVPNGATMPGATSSRNTSRVPGTDTTLYLLSYSLWELPHRQNEIDIRAAFPISTARVPQHLYQGALGSPSVGTAHASSLHPHAANSQFAGAEDAVRARLTSRRQAATPSPEAFFPSADCPRAAGSKADGGGEGVARMASHMMRIIIVSRSTDRYSFDAEDGVCAPPARTIVSMHRDPRARDVPPERWLPSYVPGSKDGGGGGVARMASRRMPFRTGSSLAHIIMRVVLVAVMFPAAMECTLCACPRATSSSSPPLSLPRPTWSPDEQCLTLSSRDGYCTLVTFDEILPTHHTQQAALQLQIAAQHSAPILHASSSHSHTSGSGSQMGGSRKCLLEPLTPGARRVSMGTGSGTL